MRKLLVATAIAFAVLPVSGAAAAGLTVVSGPSPYAGCSDANQPGTNYPNAEVEPQVAVNPATVGTSHVNVVGVWQQDRWSNGGAHGLVAGFSSDGGAGALLRGPPRAGGRVARGGPAAPRRRRRRGGGEAPRLRRPALVPKDPGGRREGGDLPPDPRRGKEKNEGRKSRRLETGEV